MKRWKTLAALALACVPAFIDAKSPAVQASAQKIVAYYFHGARRCPTCRKIEASSADVIKGRFAKELKNGSIEWRVVNIEESANRHFVKDFELYASSLVLVADENRKKRWKNLEQVWQLVGKSEAFSRYIEDEIKQFTAGS